VQEYSAREKFEENVRKQKYRSKHIKPARRKT
jgi:hypothetical protein